MDYSRKKINVVLLLLDFLPGITTFAIQAFVDYLIPPFVTFLPAIQMISGFHLSYKEFKSFHCMCMNYGETPTSNTIKYLLIYYFSTICLSTVRLR